jgi:CMP-N-acetylneuraminic acid synthetase
MKVACFIPIKSISERVKGKNFRVLNGKKLYEHIIENTLKANIFDTIFVDTNSDEIMEYSKGKGIEIIIREPYLAENTANGNDLLIHHMKVQPNYDLYFQLFATAPFLQPESIIHCVEMLSSSTEYDSCFTATKHNGFFWLNNSPINYRPDILPRSQDLKPVCEETTGLYGIQKESLDKYRCRIGRNPYIHYISKYEAVDINTEEDLKIAEYVGKLVYKL